MLASGAIFTPWGALSPLLDAYWAPARLGGFALGIEDFLISFQTGASIWFWGSLPFRTRLVVVLAVRPMLGRATWLAAVFLPMLALLWALGFSGIAQAVIVPAILAGALLVRRPDLWPMAVSASIGYTATYAVLLTLLNALVPDTAAEWRPGQWWTTRMAGLPVGELIWAMVGAPAHMLCFAFIADAELLPARSGTSCR